MILLRDCDLADGQQVPVVELLQYPLVNVRIASRTVAPGKLQPSPFEIDARTGDMLPSIHHHLDCHGAPSSSAPMASVSAAPVQLAEDLRLGSVALIMAAGTGRPTGRAPQERLNGRSVPSKT
jgi:hypothetical protein